jgi:hypothetical protein
MRKSIKLLFILLTIGPTAFGQSKPTKSFAITGSVRKELSLTQEQLLNAKVHNIGTVDITNHKGDLKGSARNMKGILLRDLLQPVVLNEKNPKFFSEFYFVCSGTDGYKVVYSWNELFNTSVGDKVFIVTEKDGKNMLDNEDGLLMISSDDRKTGRRFVKNLETIQVRRAE